MVITFEVLGNPVGKGRPKFARRGNFVTTYTPEKTRLAEQSFLAQSLPYRPEKPLAEPLTVELAFWLPIPASWSKKKRAAALAGAIMPAKKPDIDNLCKIIDCLSGVFWVDDCLIVHICAAKRYAEIPSTTIWIETI